MFGWLLTPSRLQLRYGWTVHAWSRVCGDHRRNCEWVSRRWDRSFTMGRVDWGPWMGGVGNPPHPGLPP
eukprot:scaffold287_cov337-Pavlova_lutheri.AAC.23